MELKDKLFNSFFYPFLISVILNTLVVALFLGFFTNNYYDRETEKNIMNLESKYSEMHLKSVNVLLSKLKLFPYNCFIFLSYAVVSFSL